MKKEYLGREIDKERQKRAKDSRKWRKEVNDGCMERKKSTCLIVSRYVQ
jgi:hypothetical protein